MMARGTDPYALWVKAGGGTPGYDRERYLDLMREHGHILSPGDDGYEAAANAAPPRETEGTSRDRDRHCPQGRPAPDHGGRHRACAYRGPAASGRGPEAVRGSARRRG